MKSIFGVLFLLLASSLTAQETNVQADLQAAEAAYAASAYAEAAAQYEALLQAGASPELYYNLGNACYKAGMIAPAILNYERALLLDPTDADIRFNLQLAQQRAVDRIEPVGEFFLTQWFRAMQHIAMPATWAKLALAAFLLLLAGMAVFFFSRRRRWKQTGFYAGLCFLAAVVLANVFAHNRRSELTSRTSAIVFAPTVTVKSSPDASGTDLFILHEGAKVRIKSSLNEWREIEVADGNLGWMPATDLEII